MKTYSNLKWFCMGLWLISSSTVALAHEITVHRGITASDEVSAFTYSPAYRDFLNAVSLDCDLAKATNTLVEGSAREDYVDQDEGGKRPYNHFYDPLRSRGLSDIPPDRHNLTLLGAISPLGKDSFTWASIRNSPGVDFPGILGVANIGKYNKWSWQNARDYEWTGLTAAYKSDRVQALTNMFRAVGQVVHLLQDTSQPQHARNEHQVFFDSFLGPVNIWHSPIEIYGDTNAS